MPSSVAFDSIGAAGSRGGRPMTSRSAGSTARARAGATSVNRLIHRNWIADIGRGMPTARAPSVTRISLKFVARRNRSDLPMFDRIVRPWATAAAIPSKSSVSSTTSATSRATSVPRAPIATPMSAARKAAASLMPSPVMATTSPPACSARTIRYLSAGDTRANTSTSCTSVRSVSGLTSSTCEASNTCGAPLPRSSSR